MEQSQLILIVGVGVALVLLFYIVSTVNRFARLRNYMRESWSDIDVMLKRRHDLIPNLVETVKGYAAYEQGVLERVVEARNRAVAETGSVGKQAAQEGELVHSVNRLLATAEAYPDLKASAQFVALQKELADTEDRIAAARRFYNANVREYNTMLQTFPASLLAGGAKPADFFEVEDLSVRAPVTVQASQF